MIRRRKTTIFTDAKENTTVAELKRMLEGNNENIFFFLFFKKMILNQDAFLFAGILKVRPLDQRLFNIENDVMDDETTLQDNGITVSTAKAQAPAQLGLVFR